MIAMCVAGTYDDIEMDTRICGHRWIAIVESGTPLFRLECPACGEQDSFVSFCPPGWCNEGAQ